MKPRHILPVLILAIAIAAVVALTRTRNDAAATKAERIEVAAPIPTPSATPVATAQPAMPVATTVASAGPTPAAPASADPVAAPVTIDRSSAKSLVRSQVAALMHGDAASFRATFLPQTKVTDRAVGACMRFAASHVINPHWDDAREVVDTSGERVLRVSINGRAATGFHNVDGGYLADNVWCAPPGAE